MTDTTTNTGKTTRAQRMAMPLARDMPRDLAVENGACIRPVQLRRINRDTGETETVPNFSGAWSRMSISRCAALSREPSCVGCWLAAEQDQTSLAARS